MDKRYFVYILTNHTNTIFYTGITNNIQRRVYEHKHVVISNAFTRRYNIYKLLWFQEFDNPLTAIEYEKKIKKYSQMKKLKLIQQKNPELKELKFEP